MYTTTLESYLNIVLRCLADIWEHKTFLYKSLINNEASVRHAIANPIINMLCKYFEYRVTLEEGENTDNDALNISSGSRYDYVCWKTMYKKNRWFDARTKYVPVVVIETKHQIDLNTNFNAVAQAIGYYSRAKKNISSTGIAMLVNEWKGDISFRIVLFPYQNNLHFGVQALLLPTITRSFVKDFNHHKEIEQLQKQDVDRQKEIDRLEKQDVDRQKEIDRLQKDIVKLQKENVNCPERNVGRQREIKRLQEGFTRKDIERL